MDADTHTHILCSYRQKEICNHVLEGRKIIKRFILQQTTEEKLQKILIVESFEGDDEKAQYANFKHIYI